MAAPTGNVRTRVQQIALPIATGARHSSQNIAFHEVGRQAVMADPEWRHGRYSEAGTSPRKAHVTPVPALEVVDAA